MRAEIEDKYYDLYLRLLVGNIEDDEIKEMDRLAKKLDKNTRKQLREEADCMLSFPQNWGI